MSLYQAARPLRTGAAETELRDGVRDSTREQVLQLIMTQGPITVAELAEKLELTSAAIRRHIAGLESDDQVTVHEGGHTGMRGRPARRYVASDRAQSSMTGAYSDLAVETIQFLADSLGPDAVTKFAEGQLAKVEERYAPQITAEDVPERVEQLAQALSADGYAASARPITGANGTTTIQLCQGHCPVQHVAAKFPEFCEAEVQTFSRLIGSHVQRLVTLAGGGHVCTTNVPIAISNRGTEPGQ